jgi:hypothetical protein
LSKIMRTSALHVLSMILKQSRLNLSLPFSRSSRRYTMGGCFKKLSVCCVLPEVSAVGAK